MLDNRQARKVLDERRDDDNDDQRREDEAEGRYQRSQHAFLIIADKGRNVDRNDARRALTDRVIIGDFIVGRPFFLLDDFRFQKRKHRIAAAEGEQPQLAEGCE